MTSRGAVKIPDRTKLLYCLPKGGIVAELGVFCGEYSEEILRYSTPEKLFLVDWWDDAEKPWPTKSAAKLCYKTVSILAQDNPKIKIEKKNAVDFLVRKPNNFFDWVYIDLDHSYEGTKKVLEVAESKIKKNGYIVGHDYTEKEGFGVIQAVDEFCASRRWVMESITTELHGYYSFALKKH